MTCSSTCQCEDVFIPEVPSSTLPCTQDSDCGTISYTTCLENVCIGGSCQSQFSSGSECYADSDCPGNNGRCTQSCQCQGGNGNGNGNNRISLRTPLVQVDLSSSEADLGLDPIIVDTNNLPDEGVMFVTGSMTLSRSGGVAGSIFYNVRWAVDGVATSVSDLIEFIIGTDITPRVNFDLELTRNGTDIILVKGSFQKTGLLGLSQISVLDVDYNFATLPMSLTMVASSTTALTTPRARVDVVHAYVLA